MGNRRLNFKLGSYSMSGIDSSLLKSLKIPAQEVNFLLFWQLAQGFKKTKRCKKIFSPEEIGC